MSPLPSSVAALFVVDGGPYSDQLGVDAWPESRDARTYAGPHPVVAHPPCAAWGAYSKPTPASTARGPLRGADGGCFASALASVLRWGGVLEHPARSHAWSAFGLERPPIGGGWSWCHGDRYVCEVEQGHYGHAARKKTWLFYVSPSLPPALAWGESSPAARPGPSHRRGIVERMSKRQRKVTPPAFRDMLLQLARGSR